MLSGDHEGQPAPNSSTLAWCPRVAAWDSGQEDGRGSPVTRLVGREEELATLVRTARRALDEGRPAAAFVFGEPGTGKTRLLHEASSRLAVPRRLTMAGYELERHVPLAAAADLLRALANAGENEPIPLELLLPERRRGVELISVFEAAHRSVSAIGPVLLTADDLQWVDEGSLSLSHFLLRAQLAASGPLAAMFASRESPGARDFAHSIEAILGPDWVSVVELSPLGREDAIELAMDAAPSLSTEEAEGLWARAGGSPFWLQALASGGGEADAGRLVAERLRRADDDATSLLALLVVLGRPAGFREVADLLSWPPDRVERSADKLVNLGIALAQSGSLQPAHDLIREAAISHLPEGDRVRLHGLIAGHLERVAGDQVNLLSEVLRHRRMAGLPSFDVALRLARSPQRRLIGGEGLEQLIAVADRESEGDGSVTLDEELAILAGDLGEEEAALDRWERIADRRADGNARARASLEASKAAFALRQPERARSHVDLARAARPSDPWLRLEIEAMDAFTVRHVDIKPAEAQDRTIRTLDAARALLGEAGGADRLAPPARRTYLEVLRQAFDRARLDRDDPYQMVALADEMVAVARSMERDRIDAIFNSAMARRPLGRWREAETGFRRVWEESHERVLPRWTTEVGYWFADSLRVLGRPDDARQVAERTIEVAGRIDDPRAASDSTWLLRLMALSSGEWPQAIAGF